MKKPQLTWSAFGQLPEAAREIRTEVFVEEQGFAEEFDALDGASWHILLALDGVPVGTARIFWESAPSVMRLGRLALRKPARGGGYGRMVLEACREAARQKGASRMVLDAQKRAKEFYEACGFTAAGDAFLEEGYPHYRMEAML